MKTKTVVMTLLVFFVSHLRVVSIVPSSRADGRYDSC